MFPDPLSPAPPRLQPPYERPAPIPVDVPIVPPEPVELSRRQRMGLWLGKKALVAFGGGDVLTFLKRALLHLDTTLAGLALWGGGIANAIHQATGPDGHINWFQLIMAIFGGSGLVAAASAKKASAQPK